MALATDFWRQGAPCVDCMLTNTAWSVGSYLAKGRTATIYPSGHHHLLHCVVAHAVCAFPNLCSPLQAGPVHSAWGLYMLLIKYACCMPADKSAAWS